jgi:hypothetical protein
MLLLPLQFFFDSVIILLGFALTLGFNTAVISMIAFGGCGVFSLRHGKKLLLFQTFYSFTPSLVKTWGYVIVTQLA